MSRTFKDKPSRLRGATDYQTDRVRLDGWGKFHYRYIQLPTTKPKKRKEVDTEYSWRIHTPMWFVRDFMNRPQRRENKLWEAKFKDKRICTWHESYIDDTIDWLDSHDTPNVSRKPYIYYD
jgi:hypothetical protein